MFNSCTFNSVKYNSLCVREAISPPIEAPTGGIRLRERVKKKVFRTEFFNLVGTKLIFSLEEFNIIGFILVTKQLGIKISGQTLKQVKEDLILKGTVSYPFRTQQEIIGFTKFKKADYFGIKGFGLMPSMQLQVLNGTKLINALSSQEIKGNKGIPAKQRNLIKGKKDISEILEALDLLDLKE